MFKKRRPGGLGFICETQHGLCQETVFFCFLQPKPFLCFVLQHQFTPQVSAVPHFALGSCKMQSDVKAVHVLLDNWSSESGFFLALSSAHCSPSQSA